MKSALSYAFYFCFFILLVSCKSCGGYSLSGINIPADVKSLSVQFFPNKAALVYPPLSQKFTEKLKDKFLKETSLTLVPGNGDFRISGEIRKYFIEPAAVTANTGTAKNKFTMSVNVVFECPSHKDLNFTEEISRFTLFDATSNFQSVESALSDEMSDQIIQEIFNKVALKW